MTRERGRSTEDWKGPWPCGIRLWERTRTGGQLRITFPAWNAPFRPVELLVNSVQIVGLLQKGVGIPLAAWGSHEVAAIYVDGSRV